MAMRMRMIRARGELKNYWEMMMIRVRCRCNCDIDRKINVAKEGKLWINRMNHMLKVNIHSKVKSLNKFKSYERKKPIYLI